MCALKRYPPLHVIFLLTILGGMVLGCVGQSPSLPPTPTTAPLASDLTIWAWPGYFPDDLLARFEAEYGVKVHYEIYDAPETIVERLQTGAEGTYDVVVLSTEYVPTMIEAGQLAELDLSRLPNFRNISANFRDLAYDPGNRHSVPFTWGTTGLLMRTDLVNPPLTRWEDLWAPRLKGQVIIWQIQRTLFNIALKTLGYPINTEQPAHLQAAYDKLLELKTRSIIGDGTLVSFVPLLMEGQGSVTFGWAYDGQLARDENLPVEYVLPTDGTILWSEQLVVPTASRHKYTAEVFINFMLRPENSAAFVNNAYYPLPVEGVEAFLDPVVRDNPLIYPPVAHLANAELSLPLSTEGQKLLDTLWAQWLAYQP